MTPKSYTFATHPFLCLTGSNELAQTEALRNLLHILFLLHPKICQGLVCTKLAVPLQVCVLAAGGSNPPWVILMLLLSVVGWDPFENTRGNKHLFGILHAISESGN